MTRTIGREVVEQGDPASDPKSFRRSLGQFSTGVTVMTTASDGEPFGVTANSFSSLSMDPPLVLWSIAQTSRSLSAFTTSKHFAVNILSVDQVEVSQRFASSSQEKFKGVDWHPGALGSPILPDILSLLECELDTTFQGGDHLILVAYFSPTWTVISADRGRGFRGTWTAFQAERGRRFSVNVDDQRSARVILRMGHAGRFFVRPCPTTGSRCARYARPCACTSKPG
jgi:flavin reductase (DIM6/NTAB) family NADH-FMN oxidoreductase RutF